MADAKTKYTIFFTAAGCGASVGIGGAGNVPTGWTETFYSQDLLTNDNLMKAKDIYIPKRAALLGFGAAIQYIRITSVADPANKRVSYVYFTTGKEGTASIFTKSPDDDYDFTAVDLLIRMQVQTGQRRQFWMGGLPDSQADQLIEAGIKGAFVNSPAFKQWFAAIQQNQWGVRWGVRNNVGNFGTINLAVPEMVRRRDRGRPFYLQHGRKVA